MSNEYLSNEDEQQILVDEQIVPQLTSGSGGENQQLVTADEQGSVFEGPAQDSTEEAMETADSTTVVLDIYKYTSAELVVMGLWKLLSKEDRKKHADKANYKHIKSDPERYKARALQ